MVSRGVVIAASARPPGPAFGSVALLPVANRALFVHALDGLRGAGVEAAAVLAEPRLVPGLHDALREAERPADGVGWLETSSEHGLRRLSRFAAGEPVAVHLADSLSHSSVGPLLQAPAGDADATIVVHEAGVQDTVVDLGRRRLAERKSLFSSSRPAGVWVLGPQVLEEACELAAQAGFENGIMAAIDRAADGGGHVATVEATDWWRFGNSPDILLDGNRFALEGLRGASVRATLIDTRIQGPVVIHPTARLESSIVRGPAVIASGARLRDAYVGPYSSIGRDVVMEGAEIEHSIVMPGASIRHLTSRLEASVVGPRAQVFRDFRLPKALRLNVGEGADIALP